MKKNKTVLVVATSSRTRGGITSVINVYRNSDFWEDWNCVWIETHIDKSSFTKIFYFIKSFINFLFLVRSACLLHCHLSGPLSAIRKLPFLLIAKILGVPTIIHLHSYSSQSNLPRSLVNFYFMFFRTADKIIVLSKSWKNGLLLDYKNFKKKIDVLHNPCPNIKRNINLKTQKIILYAGTLIKRKGYADLITAFANVVKDFPDWKLVFAGNGDIKDAKYLAKKMNVSDNIVFLGWITGEQKHKVFSKASIFCLPSYAEGFPMSILDAWAYELAVISTPVGGIPDITTDKKNILLCNPGDIPCLEKKLRILISDKKILKRMKIASKKFSSGEFSINNISKKLNEIYKELCI